MEPQQYAGLPLHKVPFRPLLYCHLDAVLQLPGSDNQNCTTSASSPGLIPPSNAHYCHCVVSDMARSHHSPEQVNNPLRDESIAKNYQIYKEGEIHKGGATGNHSQEIIHRTMRKNALKCIY